MCGILGLAGTGDSRLTLVEKGLDLLQHRGPEASRAVEFRTADRAVVLGHTRLRIIDVDERSDQPLANEDGSVQVVFNGELYNFTELRAQLVQCGHVFATATDTEVIVHLYEECDGDPVRLLSRLRGMFAFALFDGGRGSLLLARDRLGIKPMYHASTRDGGVAFASEANALVQSGLVSAGPDTTSLIGYLLWGSVQGPNAVIGGVRELLPGTYLAWGAEGATIRTWWEPRFQPRYDAVDSLDAMRSALQDSVERHLIADREVGVFLSGGVDSGSIATLAARSGAIRSLTVTFPEVGGDEAVDASITATKLGLKHDDVEVLGSEVAIWLPSIVRAMDQPTNDGVNSWIVSKAAHDAGLVVALSGVGGDELFGGYPSFSLVPRVRALSSVLRAVPTAIARGPADAIARRRPGARLPRVLMASRGVGGAYRAVRGLFGVRDLEQLGALQWVGEREALAMFTPDDPDEPDVRDAVASLELQRYLRNQLLRDTDAMSMAHSLEVRVPLLDDDVVEVALATPAEVRNKSGKAMLQEAAGFTRIGPKRGFTLPFDSWMRGPLREPVRELVLSDDLPFSWLVPQSARASLWRAFEDGHVHWSRPWTLGILRMWAVEHGYRW